MTISGNTGISAPFSSVKPTIFHAISMSLVMCGFINVMIAMNKLLKKSRKKQADVQMTLFEQCIVGNSLFFSSCSFI